MFIFLLAFCNFSSYLLFLMLNKLFVILTPRLVADFIIVGKMAKDW